MRVTLQKASELLHHGQVVAVPTETVYGLAASLDQPQAIEQIYALKGRPPLNPLIIHLDNFKRIEDYAKSFPSKFESLAHTFWPGPMTLVLPVHEEKVPERVRAGLPTAAFRIPGHLEALKLLAMTGPLVMPSANLSGRPSATCAKHIEVDFGLDFPVLDGGRCRKGLESTILYCQGKQWQIIRQGALVPEDFETILGYSPEIVGIREGQNPICPGQLYRHYAPRAQLILKEDFSEFDQGIVLGFSGRLYPENLTVWQLGLLSEPETIAENLYFLLRRLDEEGVQLAYVDMNFPNKGILASVAERLKKAAVKK